MSNKPDFVSQSHSVTRLIEDLKVGREDAATQLWNRYFGQMVTLAKHRLGNAERRVSDEEDLAASVFFALCDGAANERFDQLRNRNDLWMLLVAITSNKAVDQVRRQTTQKRGAGRVRGLSGLISPNASTDLQAQEIFSDEPSPEMLASMDDQLKNLMGLLRDDKQRRIVQLRLAGYSNPEIAKEVQISLRSVERKVEVVRDVWSSVLDD